MEGFECRVERTDTYKIYFDEKVCNEKWMEDFRQVFYNFHSLEEHAEHIAQYISRFGRGFIEGYGVPLEDGKPPYWSQQKDVNYAINVVTVREDSDIIVDVNYL